MLHLNSQRFDDVVPDEFELWMADEVCDVLFATGEKVIDADDIVTAFDEAVAQMTPQETGTASDEN